MNKIKLALIFGGKSPEHEISLISAKSIYQAIDKKKYDIKLIGIDKDGKWHMHDDNHWLVNPQDPKSIALGSASEQITIVPAKGSAWAMPLNHNENKGSPIDVAFPVLHGTYGEDGTIQGFLRAMNVPYVGADVLGSAIGMDKDVSKRLLRDAKIPVADFITLTKRNIHEWPYESVINKLGTPVFVKPANGGSSVGVHKITTGVEFEAAIHEAFQFDGKILVEEAIVGREIECAVLGNDEPAASEVGEIIPTRDFYSYEAKYLDESGAVLKIPADINVETKRLVQNTAIKAFGVLCCEGMARIDFFLKPDGSLILNEINTIPGFTSISMYPKLWEASGLAYSDLIDQLIQLALDRHKRNRRLKTNFRI